jgi:hypothetical protein
VRVIKNDWSMDLEKGIIVDIESDGLLDEATKIHVVSMAYQKEDGAWGVSSTDDYEKMRKLFLNPKVTIIGHSFITYDKPLAEKILGIEFKCTVIDTLALSWALYPWRIIHGLDKYGEEFGVKKPEVEDWEGLTYEEYRHRCEEDCKINVNVWLTMKKKLEALYSGDWDIIVNYIKYLNFKMELLAEQESNRLKVDVEKMHSNIEYFENLEREKIEAIIPHMPKVPVTTTKKRPKNLFKKDGSPSKLGEQWFDLLEKMDLPDDYGKEIVIIKDYKDPNPKSHSQVKDWLFKLGWEPKTFKESTSTNPERMGKQIPQVRIDGMLCESVLELKEKSEGIKHLDGLSVIVHRLGCLKGVRKDLKEDGYVVARASGLTNTLRFKHASPIVNLPGVTSDNGTPVEERDIIDGRFIRELFIADDDCVFVGSDLMSLEDRFKQHQIRDLDPEFVESMMVDGFDPHLDLAVYAGALTQEQADAHKNKEEKHGEVRSIYKSANYACQYGVGAETLSKAIGKSKYEAQKIIDAYWKRNWAIKEYAEAQKVVKYGKEDWIINPVNNFRYSLRSEKDRFSTLTQGGSTYVFDVWVKLLMNKGVKVGLNVHDEWGSGSIKDGEQEEVERLCKESIQKVNRILKLKRDMDCDTQVSTNYANVH